jgi:hypothetical protein
VHLLELGVDTVPSAFIVSNFLLLLGALVDSLSQLTQSSVALIVAIGAQSPYTAFDYEI